MTGKKKKSLDAEHVKINQAHQEIRDAMRKTSERIDHVMAKIRSKVERSERTGLKLVKVSR